MALLYAWSRRPWNQWDSSQCMRNCCMEIPKSNIRTWCCWLLLIRIAPGDGWSSKRTSWRWPLRSYWAFKPSSKIPNSRSDITYKTRQQKSRTSAVGLKFWRGILSWSGWWTRRGRSHIIFHRIERTRNCCCGRLQKVSQPEDCSKNHHWNLERGHNLLGKSEFHNQEKGPVL